MSNGEKYTEQQKCCREKYWSEVDDQERIKRLRNEVKKLQSEVALFAMLFKRLKEHRHCGDGEIFIPAFPADEPAFRSRYDRLGAGISRDGDDVYF